MNESESSSSNVSKVLENTSRNEQLQSKANCNDGNVLLEIIAVPNSCRERGRPEKTIANGENKK